MALPNIHLAPVSTLEELNNFFFVELFTNWVEPLFQSNCNSPKLHKINLILLLHQQSFKTIEHSSSLLHFISNLPPGITPSDLHFQPKHVMCFHTVPTHITLYRFKDLETKVVNMSPSLVIPLLCDGGKVRWPFSKPLFFHLKNENENNINDTQ